MIAALGQLGRTAGVREAIAKYNELDGSRLLDPLTVQEYNWWWYGDIFNYDDGYRDRLVQGLRKAGVPEGAGAELRLADYKRLISRRGGEYTVKGVTEIDLETTQAMLEAGAILVDVRPATDFEHGHIPGSVSLSLASALSSDSLGEVARPDDPVIFSCSWQALPLFGLRGRQGTAVGIHACLSVRRRLPDLAGGGPPGRSGQQQAVVAIQTRLE